jgi:hypothetical protein
LDDLIVRIGRMIAYQEYNTKSPLNGLAARWAAEHPQFLPIDPRALAPPLVEKAEIGTVTLRPGPLSAPSENAVPEDPWADRIVIS